MFKLAYAAILASALVAGTAFAAEPPAAPASAASAPSGPKLSPADQQRVAAIQQYQHDLVNVVALRADPDYLLGAAILARPFKDQTAGLDFASLSERAASATSAGPAARWVRLGICKDKDDCPNPDAFAYLKKNAADNAAVWLLALDIAAAHGDDKAEKAALAHAADAKVYDDYYGEALAGVAKAVGVLPPLDDTTKGAHNGQPDNPDGVRLLVAVNATQGHPRPDLEPLVNLCTTEATADDKSSREACLKIAHTLQWGSSPVGRAVGLHIQSELDPDSKAGAQEASRNLAWQVQAYSELLRRFLTNPTQASQWLASARNGGTELSLILSTLRANQVPTEAPAGSGSGAAPASATSSAH